MKTALIIFDLSGTVVKMRPPVLLAKRSTLLKLSKKYKLAIVTGAKGSETENILGKLKIKNIFSKIITKDNSIYRKPDKKLYLILKRSIKARTYVYVGDTYKDFLFAKNSKIPFFYVGKKGLGIKQDTNINNLLEYVERYLDEQ